MGCAEKMSRMLSCLGVGRCDSFSTRLMGFFNNRQWLLHVLKELIDPIVPINVQL